MDNVNGKRMFSLQYKIILFSLIIILIPCIIIGSFSYENSSQIIDRKESEANLETIKQIDSNIDFIFSDVHDTSLYLIQQDKIREFLLGEDSNFQPDSNEIANYITYLISPKSYIYSVYVKSVNGKSFDTNCAENEITYSDEEKVRLLNGGYIWTANEVTDYTGKHKVFSIIRLIKDTNNIQRTLGILKINVDESKVFDSYASYSSKIQNQRGRFFIMDNSGNYVSAMNKSLIGSKVPKQYLSPNMNNADNGYYKQDIEGQRYLISFCNVKGINWKIVSMLPLNELLKENGTVGSFTVLLSVAVFIICLVFILFFSHRYLHPLRRLSYMMRNMETGDFGDKFEVKGNDEIALLGNSFNKMSEKLNELINEVYTMKIKRKEAEFRALQAQINPHFLYNTLDTIYWLSQSENAEKTSKMVLALSKLFRISLNRGSEITTVFSEAEHLRNYIIIQQERYSDKINFITDISEETLPCRTIKLVLQPLVENAINHGIIKNGGAGNISIRVYKEGADLVFKIEDDGAGADISEITDLLEKAVEGNRGIGIKNVNERIKLYFGDNYGLKFITAPGRGMTVIVRQPFENGG